MFAFWNCDFSFFHRMNASRVCHRRSPNLLFDFGSFYHFKLWHHFLSYLCIFSSLFRICNCSLFDRGRISNSRHCISKCSESEILIIKPGIGCSSGFQFILYSFSLCCDSWKILFISTIYKLVLYLNFERMIVASIIGVFAVHIVLQCMSSGNKTTIWILK